MFNRQLNHELPLINFFKYFEFKIFCLCRHIEKPARWTQQNDNFVLNHFSEEAVFQHLEKFLQETEPKSNHELELCLMLIQCIEVNTFIAIVPLIFKSILYSYYQEVIMFNYYNKSIEFDCRILLLNSQSLLQANVERKLRFWRHCFHMELKTYTVHLLW